MIGKTHLLNAVDVDHGTENMTVQASGNPGGCTLYPAHARRGEKRRAVGLLVPTTDTAYSRTVRLHELIHAQRQGAPSVKESASLPCQARMDIRVHTVDWPDVPDSANRDACATALTDLRQIDLGQWAGAVLGSVRALAILQTSGTPRARTLASRRLAKLFPAPFIGLMNLAVQLSQLGKKNQKRADTLLRTLMFPEPSKPGNKKGSGPSGESRFRVRELPRTLDCEPVPNLCDARSGARLNRHRLTRAVISNNPAGLFRRVRPIAPRGTVLFDASGSMQMSPELLEKLCLSAPGAQVAYYCGDDNGGELVIYARDGRRAAHPGEHEEGNTVDLESIQWLLKQEGPRLLVTDMAFCGGPQGNAERAHALCALAVATGQLEVIQTCEEALERFQR